MLITITIFLRYDSFRLRILLSAIDNNTHVDRPLLKDQTGQTQYRRSYSKASAQWTVKAIKQQKKYQYLPQLLQEALKQRVSDDKPVGRKLGVSEHDPVRLAPTLAPSVAPSTSELVAKQKSRRGQSGMTATIAAQVCY